MANFILPKGFVHNSPEIEGDIAKSAAEPLTLADIGKMWKGRMPIVMDLTNLIPGSVYYNSKKTT